MGLGEAALPFAWPIRVNFKWLPIAINNIGDDFIYYLIKVWLAQETISFHNFTLIDAAYSHFSNPLGI